MVNREYGTVRIEFADDSHAARWDLGPMVVARLAKALYEWINDAPIEDLIRFKLSPRMMKEVADNLLQQYVDANRLTAFRIGVLGSSCCWMSKEDGGTGQRALVAPSSILHILPNNLVVSAWESVLQGILIGACNRVRVPLELKAEMEVMVEMLETVAPNPSEWITLLEWDSTDTERTAQETGLVNCVTIYGSDETVQNVKGLTRDHVKLVEHGFRFGVGVVEGHVVDLQNLVELLAYDFSVYDQGGCLSLRTIFLVGMLEYDAKQFGNALVESIRKRFDLIEPGRLSLANLTTLRRTYDVAFWGREQNETIISAPNDCFMVSCLHSPAEYSPPDTPRHLTVVAVSDKHELDQLLGPWKSNIASFALATAEVGNEVEQFLDFPTAVRMCQPGQLQKPELGWIHDGSPPLLPFFHISTS